MGDVCTTFSTGTPAGPVRQLERRDALVEVTAALAVSARLPLSLKACQAVTEMFDDTVGHYLERRGVEKWEGVARTFVLKRARRIGQEALRLATAAGDAEITARHVRRATDLIVEGARAAEQRTTLGVAA